MAEAFDFGRLRRLMLIHLVVQVFLFVLLGVAAFVLLNKVPSHIFTNSIIRVVIVQLVLIYPLYRFAAADAEREIAAAAVNLSAEQLNGLRRKRVFSDITKGALFIFFGTFVLRAPAAPQIQFSILFVFLLSNLAYFQCFNAVAKRQMRGKQ